MNTEWEEESVFLRTIAAGWLNRKQAGGMGKEMIWINLSEVDNCWLQTLP